MSRFLFATAPADGHTLPALPIARALIERGHSVRWYAGSSTRTGSPAIGATFMPMSDHDFSIVGVDALFPERVELRGLGQAASTTWRSASPADRDPRTRPDGPARGGARRLLVGDTGLIAGHMLTELGGPPFAALGITVLGLARAGTWRRSASVSAPSRTR